MSFHRRATAFAVAALAVALCLAAAGGAAGATPGEISRFPVRHLCFESAIAAAPHGGVLARTCEGGGEGKQSLVNVTPSGEVVRLAAVESPAGPEVVGTEGEIWAAENSLDYPYPPASVDRIAPDGTVSHLSISSGERGEQTVVRGLTIGAEGALWAAIGEFSPIGGDPFETSYGGEIVRIAPDGSEVTFQVPEGIEPLGIALGPDGNLWFTGARGFSYGEHHYTPGFGYIGRITPAGEISTYPTPSPHSGPSGIAAGPEESLWFEGSGVTTIGVGGEFGRHFALRSPAAGSGIAFGPEGDAWLGTFRGVLRLTPAGQQTVYRGVREGIAIGTEGDVWLRTESGVERIVPGGPGIDIWKVRADPATRRVTISLACGGSTQRCEGTVELTLSTGKSSVPIARIGYSVGAEYQAKVSAKVPARIFALVRRERPRGSRSRRQPPEVFARVTAKGGPTVKRWIKVPSLSAG
jgi:streptogramin lyase